MCVTHKRWFSVRPTGLFMSKPAEARAPHSTCHSHTAVLYIGLNWPSDRKIITVCWLIRTGENTVEKHKMQMLSFSVSLFGFVICSFNAFSSFQTFLSIYIYFLLCLSNLVSRLSLSKVFFISFVLVYLLTIISIKPIQNRILWKSS